MNLTDRTAVCRVLAACASLGAECRRMSEAEGRLFHLVDPEGELWHVEGEEWISGLAVPDVEIPQILPGQVRVWQAAAWGVVNNFSEVRRAKVAELERIQRERAAEEEKAQAAAFAKTLARAAKVYAQVKNLAAHEAERQLAEMDGAKRIQVIAALLVLDDGEEES